MSRRARSTGRARRARPAPPWSTQWAKDSAAAPDKSRFVFAYTNDDVNQLNAALRDVRKQRGELGEDHQFDHGAWPAAFAAGDRIQFTGTDKKAGIDNGSAGTIEQIEGSKITVQLDGRSGKRITFDATEFQTDSGTAMPARSIAARAARSTRPISITRSIGARPRAMSP